MIAMAFAWLLLRDSPHRQHALRREDHACLVLET